jgi:subfamily B ATP-binding cassette protein MsbA
VSADQGQYAPGQVYRRLWGYTRRYWPMFLVGIVGVSIDAGMQAVFIKFIEDLIDRVFVEKDSAFGLVLAGVIMVTVALRALGNFAGTYGMEWTGRRVVADLRRELFDAYLDQPARFFDRSSAGQLISKLTYNSEQVATAATDAIISVVRDVMLILYLLGLMIYLNAKLTLTMFILAPIVALIVTVISRRFRKISHRIQDSFGDVAHVTEEAVVGQRVIKVFQGQDAERARFGEANEKNRRLHMRMVATHMISSTAVQVTAGFAMVLMMVISSRPGMLEDISAGTFTSLLFAMVATIPPLKRLTSIQGKVQKGIAAADSIFRIIDGDRERDTGSRAVDRVNGELEFRGLSFGYDEGDDGDGRKVLEDISFRVPAGSVTALVGRSGSGKTTLANLLPRFYGGYDGHILLDGVELAEYRLQDLRRQIALVSQDVVLFNDTVAGNIAYGALAGASREHILKAAEDAYALEFIEALPEGLDTLVGENGTRLSGGQRQRLAIARALLKDAPILILDEATSALDAESERAIQDALEEVMKDRTTLVIAHRLSTIENADQVIVLENGRLVEAGTHEELLERGQAYAQLYQTQFSEEAAAAAGD